MTRQTSENPLSIDHWLGQADPRPFALFRIGFGLVLFQELVLRLNGFRSFLTDQGIWPHTLNTNPAAWSLFNCTTTPGTAYGLHVAGVLAVLCFLSGIYTRVATIACWVFFVSLQNRTRDISLGGDYLVSILLFWSIFANLGATFSVDAWRRRAAPTRTAAFGFRLLQMTPALVYLHAARFKVLFGRGVWIHGPAVYQTLMLDGWTRPVGAWLRQYPELCSFMGDGVLAMEFAIPLLAFCPVAIAGTRGLAILANLAVQIGIISLMKVGTFTDLMLTCSLLYVQPEWLGCLWTRLRPSRLSCMFVAWQRRVSVTEPTPPSPRARGPLLAAHAFIGTLFMAYAVFPAAWRRMPSFVVKPLVYLNLELAVDLFSHGYAMDHWEAPGVLEDGKPVDVIAVAAPGIMNGVAWRFSRWTALVGNRSAESHTKHIADYLCRAYTEESPGAVLREFRLIRVSTPPQVPGQPPGPTVRSELVHEECSPSTYRAER